MLHNTTCLLLDKIYWPAPPTIHRGLEWPQFLNSLFSVCLFSVGKFSNFFVQYKAAGVRKNVVRMNTDVQYSTVQYITVQYSI